METKQICIVEYQIATYSGEEVVYCNANEENEAIIARCKKQLKRLTSLPMYYESFKIIKRENYYGD